MTFISVLPHKYRLGKTWEHHVDLGGNSRSINGAARTDILFETTLPLMASCCFPEPELFPLHDISGDLCKAHRRARYSCSCRILSRTCTGLLANSRLPTTLLAFYERSEYWGDGYC